MDGHLIAALIFRSNEKQQCLPDSYKPAKPVGHRVEDNML